MMGDERWGSRQAPGRSQIRKGLVCFCKVFGFYLMGREEPLYNDQIFIPER